MKRLAKAACRFTKAFGHLDKVKMADHHRVKVPQIQVPLVELVNLLGYSGGPGHQPNDAPVPPANSDMSGQIGYADATMPVNLAETKLISSPDLGSMRRLMKADKHMTRGFDHLFKHMDEEDVHQTVRIQGMDLLEKATAFMNELYSHNSPVGETTAPEPRI